MLYFKPLKTTFSHKKGDLAILYTADKKKILLPSDLLPNDIKQGATLYLVLQKDLAEFQNPKYIAKAMLEEILNGGK